MLVPADLSGELTCPAIRASSAGSAVVDRGEPWFVLS
jgi:hypothetical protein